VSFCGGSLPHLKVTGSFKMVSSRLGTGNVRARKSRSCCANDMLDPSWNNGHLESGPKRKTCQRKNRTVPDARTQQSVVIDVGRCITLYRN
jgi:hypothetical protein